MNLKKKLGILIGVATLSLGLGFNGVSHSNVKTGVAKEIPFEFSIKRDIAKEIPFEFSIKRDVAKEIPFEFSIKRDLA